MAKKLPRRSDAERDPLTLYAKKLVEEWLAAEPGRTAEGLAKLIDMSGATINAVRSTSKEFKSWPKLALGLGIPEHVFVEQATKEFGHVRKGTRKTTREERYHAMPEVRAAARRDGIPADFVDAWEMKLDSDEQPTFDQLWRGLMGAWELSRGRLLGVRPVKPDEA